MTWRPDPAALDITTNHHARETVGAWELTAAERAAFDYIDWPAVDRGEASAEFIRYRGDLVDLAEFITAPPDLEALGWHGWRCDSYFSGLAIRYPDPTDPAAVVVALVTW